MSDPIKAALEAAAWAACRWPDGIACDRQDNASPCDYCRKMAASVCGALLRALPVEQPNLAEAVERAAREARDE